MKQQTRYALTFLFEINQKPWQGPIKVSAVANKYQLSVKFLEQVVARLKKAGLLWSHRGPGGGYGPDKKMIMLSDVYSALGQSVPSMSCPYPNNCRGDARCQQKEIEAKIIGKTNDELNRLKIVSC